MTGRRLVLVPVLGQIPRQGLQQTQSGRLLKELITASSTSPPFFFLLLPYLYFGENTTETAALKGAAVLIRFKC